MVIEMNGQFTSHSFTKDQFGFGTEARFGDNFSLRAGYLYESGVLSDDDRSTIYTGPTAGLSLKVPAGSNGSEIAVDYSYRTTNPFNGTHTIGLKITI